MNSLQKPTVFMVHGFRSDSSSLSYISRIIGVMYRVVSIDINITNQNLDECVQDLKNQVMLDIHNTPSRCYYFVGHSTGGLLIRNLLKIPSIADKTVACVLIATPNKGTVLADMHQSFLPKALRDIHKPIARLTRDFTRASEDQHIADIAIGGIAGLKFWKTTNGFFSVPNDGVVAVSSAYTDEMIDFIHVPCDHLSITSNYCVARATLHFLETLTFPNKLKELPLMKISEKFIFIHNKNYLDDFISKCSGNTEFGTLGGKFFWNTLSEINGWKLQKNDFTGHIRVLNPSDVRVAWGSEHNIEDIMDVVISNIRSISYIEEQSSNHPVEKKIKILKNLFDQDLITEEEFRNKKNSLLEEI